MLSLLIIRPLPGISVSTMSNFRVMKTTRIELNQNRVKLYIKNIYTHRHMHTFFLLRNHCAFILSSIQFLQDYRQLSDTGCESIREQTREWKYWIHSGKILALYTACFLLLTHISPKDNIMHCTRQNLLKLYEDSWTTCTSSFPKSHKLLPVKNNQ